MSSEIGALQQVIVHRPGIEIARITPENKGRLLFDDLLWLERAQEEHDRFVEIMRGRGVEVLYLRDLLEETLADDDVRGQVVETVVSPSVTGHRVARRLDEELRRCEVSDLLDVLLGGVLRLELPAWGIDALFAGLVSDRFDAVMPALPNMLFMRDNAAWIGDGLMLSVLAAPARRPESVLVSTVYRHHPTLAVGDRPIWYGDGEHDVIPASVEGGDVLVLYDRTVLVGSGERTSPAAVEGLARRLFAGGRVQRVIVAHMPSRRSFMHLDTVFTMVDVDAVNVFPNVLDAMEVFVLEPDTPDSLAVRQADGLVPAIEEALDRRLRVITTGGDAIGRMREQWDDGNNTLALAPGVVVAYARNQETNRRLRDAGIEVLELDASELCRGRGGSRCLTQPVQRAEVDWG